MKIIETTEKMVFISIFLSLIFLTGSLSDVAKVKVSLYYESLCPFCDKYIVEQLYPTYQKLGRHTDLDYIPYGNAKTTYHPSNSSYTFIASMDQRSAWATRFKVVCVMNSMIQITMLCFCNFIL